MLHPPDKEVTILFYPGGDYLLICELGGGAKRYDLTPKQIAGLLEQLAKSAAEKLRAKCT